MIPALGLDFTKRAMEKYPDIILMAPIVLATRDCHGNVKHPPNQPEPTDFNLRAVSMLLRESVNILLAKVGLYTKPIRRQEQNPEDPAVEDKELKKCICLAEQLQEQINGLKIAVERSSVSSDYQTETVSLDELEHIFAYLGISEQDLLVALQRILRDCHGLSKGIIPILYQTSC